MFVQCGHIRDKEGEVLQVLTFALFWRKNYRIFRNLWLVRTDKERLSQCRHFADKREGSIFRNFVRMSVMEDPLHKIRQRSAIG